MPRKKIFDTPLPEIPDPKAVKSAAADQGFDRGLTTDTQNKLDQNREIRDLEVRKPKRYRTGRDAQLNLKVTPECRAELVRVADDNGWGLGETLEHLLWKWRSN